MLPSARAKAMRRLTAQAVILATGGYAALWSRTTNAPETRGSGLALAFQAGASLADLEFVQFHPTALALDGAPTLLLSEALRGEGARLVDDDDHDVIDPLLPRDVLARALHRELAHGRRVYLSLRHLDADHVYDHFSSLGAKLKDTSGLDLARDRLPVAPAAHYCMGGIRTDTWGRTDIRGLYAAGETACSGVQGANRLASNSLLECLVFGARTAEAALHDGGKDAATWDTTPLSAATPALDLLPRVVTTAALGDALDRDVGVERNGDDLVHRVMALPDPEHAPPADLQVASLITRAALLRRESRGAHFRTDYPEPDPSWRGRIHWRRGEAPVFEEVFA
jgi:L-aspartate oxidase